MNYIVLSQLLAKKIDEKWKYMLPICKNSKIENNYTNIIYTKEAIERGKLYIKKNNLKPMLMIGHFLENNKDLDLIKQFLLSNKIFLFFFVQNLTPELNQKILPYSRNTFCGIRFSTKMIEKFIEDYNIDYLLFAPPKDSKFFKSQWSGSIAFGLNRNMTIIMPNKLAIEYELTKCVIGYKENENIDKLINSLERKDTNEVRSKIYERNSKVLKVLLTKKSQDKQYITNSCLLI